MTRPRRPAVDNASCRIVASIERVTVQASENNRLKRLLAEAHLDIEALKIGFGVKR